MVGIEIRLEKRLKYQKRMLRLTNHPSYLKAIEETKDYLRLLKKYNHK